MLAMEPLAGVHYLDPGASEALGRALLDAYLTEPAAGPVPRLPVFFLVGAPSTTGDALRPLVGWFLSRKGFVGAWVGDLQRPVHAENLQERADEARKLARDRGREPWLVGVDAAVGRTGQVALYPGPLRPGAGMGKALPLAGHVHIMAGIANAPFGVWFADLSLTMGMAEVIADAISLFWPATTEPLHFRAAFGTVGIGTAT